MGPYRLFQHTHSLKRTIGKTMILCTHYLAPGPPSTIFYILNLMYLLTIVASFGVVYLAEIQWLMHRMSRREARILALLQWLDRKYSQNAIVSSPAPFPKGNGHTMRLSPTLFATSHSGQLNTSHESVFFNICVWTRMGVETRMSPVSPSQSCRVILGLDPCKYYCYTYTCSC